MLAISSGQYRYRQLDADPRYSADAWRRGIDTIISNVSSFSIFDGQIFRKGCVLLAK